MGIRKVLTKMFCNKTYFESLKAMKVLLINRNKPFVILKMKNRIIYTDDWFMKFKAGAQTFIPRRKIVEIIIAIMVINVIEVFM